MKELNRFRNINNPFFYSQLYEMEYFNSCMYVMDKYIYIYIYIFFFSMNNIVILEG